MLHFSRMRNRIWTIGYFVETSYEKYDTMIYSRYREGLIVTDRNTNNFTCDPKLGSLNVSKCDDSEMLSRPDRRASVRSFVPQIMGMYSEPEVLWATATSDCEM